MKKIFLSLLAIFAMVGMANAQRAWAYDLGLGYESDTYTFTFKATTAANATLIFTDAEGTELATHDAGAVVAGTNTVALTKEQLPEGTEIHWAVKLTGDAIAAGTTLKELNSKLFYNMMGIVADKNPESNDFGKVYMQMAYDGKPTYGDAKQTQGFFIFDPIFNLLNTDANAGVKPTLPAGYTFDGSNRLQFHRVDIDPKTGNLVFCYSVADKPGVFSVSRDNLTGDVANLLAGVTGIEDVTRTNALCFDEDGVLYVIANVTTTSTKGNIYKIADGVATKLTLKDTKIWIDEQVGLVSDGRGGLWVAQNRYGITQNSALFHVNVAKDSIDFVLETGKEYSDWFTGNNCRGGIAYNTKEDLLAVHGAAAASLFKVTYDAETGVPTITKWLQATTGGKNTDAIAFDYAGDLYTGNSSGEYFKKFEVPTTNNSCTTPAPKAQVIINSNAVVTYAISVTANDPAMGTVTGAGNYLADESATLTATANTGYRFVNWTVGEETLAENPLTLIVNSDLTVTANFEAIPTYTITASVNDENMGAVEGAGKYYKGEEVTLKAVANTGHEFVDWNNGATEATLTFVAAKDSAVVANFKKRSYTLTVFVNDENKGSVDVVTGAYEYGAEVTLTATPAEGYELLAWSSKETTAQITVTMDNHKAVSAYFVKSYTQEPTFTIEKLWENTQVPSATGNGYQAVGWDGKIYMQNSGASKIMSYTNGTDAATEYATSGAGYQIAIDEAGNLIVYNGYFATTTHNNVLIYAKGSTTGKQVTFTLPQDARCDFFTASGDIYSEEGGYIYFYCNGTTVVNRLKITNGAATDADVTTDVICANLPGAGTQSNVVIDIYGNIHVESKNKTAGVYNITTLAVTNDTYLGAASKATPTSTIGGCTFELGGKELWAYLVGTTNYSSEWQLYNATTGVSIADELYLTDNKSAAGITANWLNVQVVDEKTAYIYQFCPKVAVAVWKVTCDTGEEPGTGTAVDNTTVAPQVQKIVREGQVLIIRDGKIFNMMGQEVK